MTKHLFTLILAAGLVGGPALGCDEGEAAATESASGGAAEATEAAPVEVTVSSSGYDPSEVEATAGQPLTIIFTRTEEEGCGDTLVIAEADIERELPVGEPVEVTFTPSAAGELRFSCGMDMYDGKIVVR